MIAPVCTLIPKGNRSFGSRVGSWRLKYSTALVITAGICIADLTRDGAWNGDGLSASESINAVCVLFVEFYLDERIWKRIYDENSSGNWDESSSPIDQQFHRMQLICCIWTILSLETRVGCDKIAMRNPSLFNGEINQWAALANEILPSSPRVEFRSSSDVGRLVQYLHCNCPVTTLIVWLLEWYRTSFKSIRPVKREKWMEPRCIYSLLPSRS